MKPEDFDLLANIVKQQSGIVLTRDKAYLLGSRLPQVARKWNLKGIEDLAQSIRNQRDEKMLMEITEAMATNESSFFRDQKPFEQFRGNVLPKLIKSRANRRHLRIWSAASSSGQEAYSLAMQCAEERAGLEGWKIDIIGTDLSQEMVERAKSGFYSHFEVQRGLPITMLIKYFQQVGDKWQIRDNIRKMVDFRVVNLLHDFGPIGMFDVIFCRNVLMYFDVTTRTRVMDALTAVLAPDGALFLGNVETANGISEKFRPLEGERGPYVLASA